MYPAAAGGTTVVTLTAVMGYALLATPDGATPGSPCASGGTTT